MIIDYKALEFFPVQVARLVTNFSHKAIADYTLDFIKTNNLDYTTYHDEKLNQRYQDSFPEVDLFSETIVNGGNMLMNQINLTHNNNPHTYFWGSSYEIGDGHSLHVHPNSTLSGTYWPVAEEGCSAIVFRNPAASRMMYGNWGSVQEERYYQPKSGDMLIWPSWLEHKVNTQKRDAKRVAISFNIIYGN